MRILGFDLSLHAGWAVMEGTNLQDAKLGSYGTIHLGKNVLEFGPYPWCYREAAKAQIAKVAAVIKEVRPDVIVVEETNGGGRANRYSMKILEFLHLTLLSHLSEAFAGRVVYINSGEWRTNLGMKMTKDQKKANAKLRKATKEAAKRKVAVDKKALGIKGLVSPKHVAIAWVNERFELLLKVKDNDAADAIALCCAVLNGAEPCDGT